MRVKVSELKPGMKVRWDSGICDVVERVSPLNARERHYVRFMSRSSMYLSAGFEFELLEAE